MSSVISISCSEARIELVRSDATCSLMSLRQLRLQLGQQRAHAVDGLDDVGARLARDQHDHRRLAVEQAQRVDVLDAVGDVGDVLQAHGGAVAPGDDQAAVVGRGAAAGRRWSPACRSAGAGRCPRCAPLGRLALAAWMAARTSSAGDAVAGSARTGSGRRAPPAASRRRSRRRRRPAPAPASAARCWRPRRRSGRGVRVFEVSARMITGASDGLALR